MLNKNLLAAALLLALAPLRAWACDICGCFMGITPYDNQSTFALMHRYRSFNGYQALGQRPQFRPPGGTMFAPGRLNSDDGYRHSHRGDPSDFEIFRTVELRGKYFLAKRLELNAFMPFIMNTEQSNGQQLNISGLGDVTVFAGYHVLRRIETAGVQSRLIVGGGLKLPTGDYRRQSPDGRRYAMLTQPGTGTTDVFGYANYIASYRSVGLSLNQSYRRANANAFGNSVAPSVATFANLFYRVARGESWQFYPSAQFYYEKTAGEMLDGQLTHEHEMNAALLGPGLDVYYKNFSLNTSVQFPVYTAATDHPASAGRLVLAVGYSLNQTKFLIK